MIYIDDGVNIDASWVNHIAISNDGNNWTTINKHQLDVKQRTLSMNNSAERRHPWVNKGTHSLITISRSESEPIMVFDPNDVVNQPTWQGNTPTALQNAVADITGWI
jgi:hypothetical protein